MLIIKRKRCIWNTMQGATAAKWKTNRKWILRLIKWCVLVYFLSWYSVLKMNCNAFIGHLNKSVRIIHGVHMVVGAFASSLNAKCETGRLIWFYYNSRTVSWYAFLVLAHPNKFDFSFCFCSKYYDSSIKNKALKLEIDAFNLFAFRIVVVAARFVSSEQWLTWKNSHV